MSNATVSSQVFVVRNAGALAAVDSSTMIIYADGSDVFAKDSSNVVYNLTSPSASSISLTLEQLTNVNSGASNGQIIQWDGSAWVPVDFTLALNALSDVTVAGAANGQYLKFNGSAWVAATISSGGSVAGLYDVGDVYDYDAGDAPSNGETLIWSSNQWAPAPTLSTLTFTDGVTSFNLTDTDVIRIMSNTGLSTAVNQTTHEIAFSLDSPLSGLNDASYSGTPASGQVLQWTGSAWQNSNLLITEISDVDTLGSLAPSTTGQALLWNQTNGKWETSSKIANVVSPFIIKRFQLVPFDYVPTAGSGGTMDIGAPAAPPKQAYFDEVFTDSSPVAASSMVISLFPTFQVKPTMTDNGDNGSLILKIDGNNISETFVVELLGSVKSGGNTYNSAAAVSKNLAFASNTSATVTISAADIDALTPKTIMNANSQSDADFEEWILTFTIKTFQGNITNRTISVDTLNLPVEQ